LNIEAKEKASTGFWEVTVEAAAKVCIQPGTSAKLL
jgi:hypothetical protein